MDAHCVAREVQTEYLYVMWINFGLQGVKMEIR